VFAVRRPIKNRALLHHTPGAGAVGHCFEHYARCNCHESGATYRCQMDPAAGTA
jgi:hypothetical protein